MAKKKIAVLTSGGDAPGMNAAIRAVVRAGIYLGFDVYGIKRGYAGLLEEDIEKLNVRSVSNIINKGGTMLHSSRCPEMMTEEGQKKAAEICKRRGFDGVVCIGGDGTFRGAKTLADNGVMVVGIPATIDNDIGCSEYTIGFDTAINTAVDLCDKVRDTTTSHDRCSIVEVMGRRCGDIAIHTAIATGAFAVLIPEMESSFEEDIVKPMLKAKESGKTNFLIINAEGVGHSVELAEKIEKETGFAARATILGHVQRGGAPSQKDRVSAAIMGGTAVSLIKQADATQLLSSRVLCIKNDAVVDMDIEDALAMKRVFNRDTYNIMKAVSI